MSKSFWQYANQTKRLYDLVVCLRPLFLAQPLSTHRLPYTREFNKLLVGVVQAGHLPDLDASETILWGHLDQLQYFPDWSKDHCCVERPLRYFEKLSPELRATLEKRVKKEYRSLRQRANGRLPVNRLPYTKTFDRLHHTIVLWLHDHRLIMRGALNLMVSHREPTKEETWMEIKGVARRPKRSEQVRLEPLATLTREQGFVDRDTLR